MTEYLDLLGKRVRDRVTGGEGVVESISVDLYGCIQAVVRPPACRDKDGKQEYPEGRWYDCKRLEVLDPVPVMDVPTFARARGAENGPADKPPQSSTNPAR